MFFPRQQFNTTSGCSAETVWQQMLLWQKFCHGAGSVKDQN